MDTTTTDFKVSTSTGHLLNALRHIEAARSFLYQRDEEMFGEETAYKMSDEYDAVLDPARDYVKKELEDELIAWANHVDPNEPL